MQVCIQHSKKTWFGAMPQTGWLALHYCPTESDANEASSAHASALLKCTKSTREHIEYCSSNTKRLTLSGCAQELTNMTEKVQIAQAINFVLPAAAKDSEVTLNNCLC